MNRVQRLLRLALLLVGSLGLAVFTRIRPYRWLSPSISLRTLRFYFEPGSALVAARIRDHVPDGGRTVLTDLRYGDGRDGLFDLVVPDGGEPAPLIVWLHGGGWYYGSKADPLPYLELLATHGFASASLNYPRIPEHRHPAGPRAVVEALSYLVEHGAEHGVDPSRIVLAGDSAGAQLAASAALACVSPAYATALGVQNPLPDGVLRGTALFCGSFNAAALLDSGRMFTAILASAMWAQAGTRDWLGTEAAELITIREHLTPAFPPTFLRAGNADPLTADGTVPMAAALADLGVDLDAAVLGDATTPVPHQLQFALGTDAGQAVLTDLVDFLLRVTD